MAYPVKPLAYKPAVHNCNAEATAAATDATSGDKQIATARFASNCCFKPLTPKSYSKAQRPDSFFQFALPDASVPMLCLPSTAAQEPPAP